MNKLSGTTYLNNNVIYRSQRLFALVDASMLLIRRQSVILKTPEHHVNVLQASTSLLLFAISCLNSLCPDNEKSYKHEKIKNTFEMLKTTLWKWITSSSVIGGSVFGGDITYWKGELELKVSSTTIMWKGITIIETLI